MKINVEVECSPEEARAFLGLPNVVPLQDAMMLELENRMKQGMSAMDLETLARTWLPMGVQGMENLQKAFWAAATGALGGGDRK